jgi:acetylornithine deacetylase/succinyl-diaminopimelate desuccinylase-like protein
MARLTLSDADKQARDWFVKTIESLGCKVKIDAMGIILILKSTGDSATDNTLCNIFAIRPGKNNSAAPTYAGSHLDTQVLSTRPHSRRRLRSD